MKQSRQVLLGLERLNLRPILIQKYQIETHSSDKQSMKQFVLLTKFSSYFFVIFMGSFANITLQAGERYEFYNGVRGLGMGGASIGVVNDETALILNPAGMGKLRNAFATIIDPEVHVNGGSSQSLLAGGGDLSSLNTAQGMVDSMGTTADVHSHFGYQLFPSLVLPNFGIGVLYKTFYDGQNSTDGSTADLFYRNDLAVVLGYNITLFDGRIKFGFSGRYINRKESFLDDVSTGATNLDFSSNEVDGAGLGLDAGIILSAPWALLPSLAIVMRDFGNTSYNLSGGSATDPTTTLQTIDAAFSLFPIHGNHIRSSFTIEMRDITNVLEETEANRRYHIGWELNTADLLFARLGWNQNSWTAGVEFAMERAQFQIASYAEDVNDDGATRIEDRRYVAKFVFRF